MQFIVRVYSMASSIILRDVVGKTFLTAIKYGHILVLAQVTSLFSVWSNILTVLDFPSSFSSSSALGSGLRLGFLGNLHLEVFTQRLKNESDIDVICTAPSVKFRNRSTLIWHINEKTISEFYHAIFLQHCNSLWWLNNYYVKINNEMRYKYPWRKIKI